MTCGFLIIRYECGFGLRGIFMKIMVTTARAILIGGLLAATGGAASAAVTVYTSQGAFDAAAPGERTFGFNAGGATTFLPIPFSLNGLSFSSNLTPGEPGNGGGPALALVPVSDTPTYGVDFLTFQNTLVGIQAEIDSLGTSAIGFTYGSYVYNSPSDATVWVNGVDVATVTPLTTAAFIGFTSTSPITSVVFNYPGASDGSTGGYAFDLTSVSTVPEPSTWAMMGLGFGGLAFAGYRRSKTGRSALAA